MLRKCGKVKRNRLFFFWLSLISLVLRNWKQLKTDRIEPIEIQSRNGNGSGFSISGPDPRAKTLGPDPARLLDDFFFWGPDLPQLGPAGSTGLVGLWYFRAHFVAQ